MSYISCITSLNRKDIKTVNLELLKDGEILECKVKTNSWSYINCYVTSYSVVGKEKSEQFGKIFEGTNGDALFDNIIKISYNRNILYERAS